MTSTVTPSVASGSSAAASSSTPLGTGNANSLATPVPSATQMTYDQVLAENARRVASNAALQVLRDAGNLNVAQDEPLLPLPPSPSAGNRLQQWISAFVNLSPTSQAQGAAVLEGIAGSSRNVAARPNTTSIAKALFDSSKEIATSSGLDSTYNFGIHHFIQDLANAGEYCPLTLFSNKNTERLHREGHSLKCTKVHVNGVSHHLLDLSQFESERDLDPLTWQEAFQRYLSWIADVGDAPSVKRWTSHFTTLAKDEAIRKNFRAILEFDIETRQNYALCPHQHDEAEWSHRLQKKKYATLQDELFRHSQQLRSSLVDRPFIAGSSSRFEPYDKDSSSKRPFKKNEGEPSSFRDSKSAKSTDPMCIICRRTGHRFSACTEETSSKGAQNFAKYTDGNLCKRSNNSQLCIGFNLNNPRRPCKRDHTDQHLCSFCGRPEHGALSRSCL